jgi:hypothetical protein
MRIGPFIPCYIDRFFPGVGVATLELRATHLRCTRPNCAGDHGPRRIRSPHSSHSGLLEPRGTSTVVKDPGVRDMTTWSVIP